MRLLIALAILLPLTAHALTTDLSGNIEGQWRHSKNNEAAKEDLYQNWSEEDFYLAYGNLNGKIEMGDSRLEANWFVRYTQSDLYNPDPYGPLNSTEPYLATRIFTFPNRLVARDIFQMQSKDQHGNHQTESVLNKLYYEWDYDEHRIMIGRMYINYGQGEIFNPINPFNQPTALTAVSQVAQGNDGASFTAFMTDKHTVQFILLGDKAIEGYTGKINRTLWVHGEYQYSDKLQLDYVIGEDQKRNKVGGQASYAFEEAMAFTQVLYQSNYVTSDQGSSNNLWDVLLGYDEQLTQKWHVRIEGGYQKKNRFLDPTRFERFLPTEYFLAVANVYEIHPLVKLTGTLINDVKSGFSYFVGKSTYSFTSNTEIEGFVFSPISKGDATEFEAQKLVTTDIGLSLRAFF